MDFLFIFFAAAKLDARSALCLGSIHAGALQIVGAVCNVRAQFLLKFSVDPVTLEQSGDAEAKRVEEVHISSGCCDSADAIAVARRFQLSVSSRKRLRPAAVNS